MSSEEEVSAILSAETHVEIDKLRVAAKHGIPPKLRGEAWKYLLSVSRPDKSEEMSTRRRDAEEYAKLDKANVGLLRQVKAEAKRRTARGGHGPSRALLGSPQTAKRLENIIAAFLNHNAHLEYDPGMVHLLCPFVYALDDEADAFHCFARLMKHLEPHFNVAGARHDLAHFVALFRELLPELHEHFEAEELEYNEWALPWLQFLLSRELPLECVARLWDSYLAAENAEALFRFHEFACLAVLDRAAEELMECDHSEIKHFLRNLPQMDMEGVLARAHHLRATAEASTTHF